jgi:hypothetical protein
MGTKAIYEGSSWAPRPYMRAAQGTKATNKLEAGNQGHFKKNLIDINLIDIKVFFYILNDPR